jgi:uncharacterized protein YaiE (UPF0345 family)
MPYVAPEQFVNVTLTCKANIYFDGKVVSHSLLLADGRKKTLGVIFPGSYRFDTAAPERMEIIAGTCRVRLAEGTDWVGFGAGTWFDVPGDSSFEIAVDTGLAEYVCSFG